MLFNASKIIVSLPSTLEPNTVYFVRVGNGFDLYCTDALGLIAHKINSSSNSQDALITEAIGSENLSAGDFINLYQDNSLTKARKAIANDFNKIAHGFVLVNSSINSSAIVFNKGINTAITLQSNSIYYLSATTSGLATNSPPDDVSGNFQQTLGFATGSGFFFEFNTPILIA